MDQAIYNKIVSYIRGIEDNLGSRSHFTPGNRSHPADAKKQ
ncbi:MAG: hypothetical protein WAS73_11800 [Defluviicoccus sp.]